MRFHQNLPALLRSKRLVFLLAAIPLLPKTSAQSNEIVFGTQTSGQRSSPGDSSLTDLSTSTDTYNLHGIVLDSRTGKPIARALVQAFGDRIATMTDRDGRFALEVRFSNSGPIANLRRNVSNLQMMVMNVTARKPGYSYANSSARQMRSTRTSELDKDIVLKLTPESVIEGHVVASGDDHPENVYVTLMYRQVQGGYARWQQTGGASTNSRGDFRIGGLMPGDYEILTREWSEQPGQPLEADHPVSRYAPVHFPPGGSTASVPSFHLSAGEVLPVNLNLHAETFYPVRIPVASAGALGGGVQVRVATEGGVPGYAMRYNAREKAVEGLLPSGTYQITLQSGGQGDAAVTVPLTVRGAATETGPVTLVPVPPIPVVVHEDFTNKDAPQIQGLPPNFPPVQVMLIPEDTTMPGPNMSPYDEHKGGILLQRVLPGAYRIQANAMRGYVAAVTSGGTDLLRTPLTVAPGSTVEPIEVTLRDDTGSIRGTVDSSLLNGSDGTGDDTTAVFVHIVPTDSIAQQSREMFIQPNGTFYSGSIAPGSYRLYASHAPFNNVDYRSEAFLKRNGSKAATLIVNPGETATVTITSLIEEEP